MMKPWYVRNPSFFRSEIDSVGKNWPNLKIKNRDGIIQLSGFINYRIELGGEIIEDAYSVEVELPNNYPQSLPLVKEIGGRKERLLAQRSIKAMADLHYNERQDEIACLCVRLEEGLICPFEDRNIKNIMDKLILPFFWNQTYFEKHGEWINGEYGHSIKGIIQSYEKHLQVENQELIVKCIELLSFGKNIKGHHECICGSEKRFKDCHPKLLKLLWSTKNASTLQNMKLDMDNIIEVAVKTRENQKMQKI